MSLKLLETLGLWMLRKCHSTCAKAKDKSEIRERGCCSQFKGSYLWFPTRWGLRTENQKQAVGPSLMFRTTSVPSQGLPAPGPLQICFWILYLSLQSPRFTRLFPLKNSFFFFLCFGQATQHTLSQFLDQGLNLSPVQFKYRVLTTRLPGKSLTNTIFFFFKMQLTLKISEV